jgi:hypothetical protein
LALAASLGAVSADAVVRSVHGHGYGITPIAGSAEQSLVAPSQAHRASPPAHARRFDEPPFGGSRLESQGGPVMHSATTHVIYWDPSPAQFTSTTKGIVEGFFVDVAHDSGLATNVFAVAGQYTDSTGHSAYSSTFAGALRDGNPYPTSGNCKTPNEADKGPYATCLFDGQLQSELTAFIGEDGLPTGPTQLYFILLPHNVASCLPEVLEGKQVCSNNFYCAYHSYIRPGQSNEIIYADIPFSLLDTNFAKGCQADGNAEIQLPGGDRGASNAETRFADVALKYLSHEYIEAATDPLVNFETAWVDEEGEEVADKCNGVPFSEEEEGEPGFDRQAFTPTLGGSAVSGTLFNQLINGGGFYLQSEWDNAAGACLMKPLALGAGSFAPPGGTAGAVVSFTGSSSDPYGGFEPTWDFGDGTGGAGASTSHVYSSAGSYTVTMTPKDSLTGSTGEPVSHTVTIASAPVASPSSPVTPPPGPNSTFTVKPATNPKTGAITVTISLLNPGAFSWAATFPNGKFGAFASRRRCKAPRVRLAGKCLSAKITFAQGRKLFATAGVIRVTLAPSAAARKALKNALRRKKGLPVTVVLTFQSALGGPPVAHSDTVTVRPTK